MRKDIFFSGDRNVKFIEDFKKFIFKGNVIDIAVGVGIVAAFCQIVTGRFN